VASPRRRGGARNRVPAALVAAIAVVVWSGADSPAGTSAGRSCDRLASASGSDGDGGSIRAPYRTVQRLVESLAPGETGCLRGGTYRFSQLIIATRGITLTRYGRSPVTLKGEIKVPPGGAGSVIRGLRLNGSGGRNDIGPRINADGVALRGNWITNQHRGICITIGSWFGGPPPRGVVIAGNRIHDCGRLPPTNHEHGIYVAEARGTIIRDNWIYDNADRGIQLYPDAHGSLITGNVIDGNGEGVIFSGDGSGDCSNDNLVKGNVISNSRIRWNVSSGPQGRPCTGNVVRRNCVYGSGADPYYRRHGGVQTPSRSFRARGNRIAKPAFLHRARGNLRLRRGTRCVRLLR
jgi:parallel beta-helix repeat protein